MTPDPQATKPKQAGGNASTLTMGKQKQKRARTLCERKPGDVALIVPIDIHTLWQELDSEPAYLHKKDEVSNQEWRHLLSLMCLVPGALVMKVGHDNCGKKKTVGKMKMGCARRYEGINWRATKALWRREGIKCEKRLMKRLQSNLWVTPQGMKREARAALFMRPPKQGMEKPEDLDMKKAHPSIMHDLLHAASRPCSHIKHYIKNADQWRDAMLEAYFLEGTCDDDDKLDPPWTPSDWCKQFFTSTLFKAAQGADDKINRFREQHVLTCEPKEPTCAVPTDHPSFQSDMSALESLEAFIGGFVTEVCHGRDTLLSMKAFEGLPMAYVNGPKFLQLAKDKKMRIQVSKSLGLYGDKELKDLNVEGCAFALLLQTVEDLLLEEARWVAVTKHSVMVLSLIYDGMIVSRVCGGASSEIVIGDINAVMIEAGFPSVCFKAKPLRSRSVEEHMRLNGGRVEPCDLVLDDAMSNSQRQVQPFVPAVEFDDVRDAQYVEEIVFPVGVDIIIINAQVSMGKSTQMMAYLRKHNLLRVLFIVPRRSLGRELLSKLKRQGFDDVVFYEDVRGSEPWEELNNCDWLIIQIDSLYKLYPDGNPPFDIVFIDEINAVMRQCSASRWANINWQNMQTYLRMKQTKVCLLDAFAGIQADHLIQCSKVTPSRCSWIQYTHQAYPELKVTFHYDNKSISGVVGDNRESSLYKWLDTGEKLYIPCSSVERARTAKGLILSHTGCNEEDIGFIIGDDAKGFTCDERRRKEDFLSDINTHASRCRYLIVSPSVTVGNSIDLGLLGCDLPNPFDRTVALVDAMVMCWEDVLQQIFRVRHVKQNSVEVVCFHIKDRSSEMEPLPARRNPSDVFQDMAYPERMTRMLQSFGTASDIPMPGEVKRRIDTGGFEVPDPTGLWYYRAMVMAEGLDRPFWLVNDLHAAFLAMGATVCHKADASEENGPTAASKVSRIDNETKKRKREEALHAAASSELTDAERDEIDNKKDNELDKTHQWKRQVRQVLNVFDFGHGDDLQKNTNVFHKFVRQPARAELAAMAQADAKCEAESQGQPPEKRHKPEKVVPNEKFIFEVLSDAKNQAVYQTLKVLRPYGDMQRMLYAAEQAYEAASNVQHQHGGKESAEATKWMGVRHALRVLRKLGFSTPWDTTTSCKLADYTLEDIKEVLLLCHEWCELNVQSQGVATVKQLKIDLMLCKPGMDNELRTYTGEVVTQCNQRLLDKYLGVKLTVSNRSSQAYKGDKNSALYKLSGFTVQHLRLSREEPESAKPALFAPEGGQVSITDCQIILTNDGDGITTGAVTNNYSVPKRLDEIYVMKSRPEAGSADGARRIS